MPLPYATATAGDRALAELQKILSGFGCQRFGTMTDQVRGVTIVQFTWQTRTVSLEASWKGYAVAWLKAHPYTYRTRGTRQAYEERAQAQARISVCSILRDWVKGQVTAVECGIMSFEAAFLPHMLLPTGERFIDRINAQHLLAADAQETNA
jgi:hypothetical protein